MLSSIFVGITSLLAAASVSAAPAPAPVPVNFHTLFTASYFEVSHMNITKRVNGGNVTIQFNVHDPEPYANKTADTTCTRSWKTGSHGFPSGPYVACKGNDFQWQMEEFTSVEDFKIAISHYFYDYSIGDYVSTFGHAYFNTTSKALKCTKGAEGLRNNEDCLQAKKIVQAPITETTL